MSEPSPEELRGFLAIALEAAKLAEQVIMPLYLEGTSVEFKSDNTPVTAADRGAEEAIREFLQRECPSHGILGEEFGETPSDSQYRWILDPIDGTKSFIHHVPLFGSLISLEYANQPVVGVIACHAAGETASGARDLGASINGRPIAVSDIESMSEATVLATSPQGMHVHHNESWTRLCAEARLLRSWGDCYGYLMVAAGRAEVMLDPIMNIWDASALYPIITEAGGTITTWDGLPGPGESVVATNGRLHERTLAILREG